jgi:hypothetical protein
VNVSFLSIGVDYFQVLAMFRGRYLNMVKVLLPVYVIIDIFIFFNIVELHGLKSCNLYFDGCQYLNSTLK